jgi:hypothetical protein
LLSRCWRRCAALITVVLLVACAPPPVQRPREGAPPIAGGTPVRLESVVPPTLSAFSAPPTSTPNPLIEPIGSPSPGIASSPSGSPGLAPIISGLQPAPGASLPAGDVVISARISGSTDLADVIAFVDGEGVELEPIGPGVRVKTISFVRSFGGGSHEVRVQARDIQNQLGGYRWQFTVGAGRQPASAPTAVKPVPPTSPVQARTPVPVPTRRPTVVLPKPAASPARPAPR